MGKKRRRQRGYERRRWSKIERMNGTILEIERLERDPRNVKRDPDPAPLNDRRRIMDLG